MVSGPGAVTIVLFHFEVSESLFQGEAIYDRIRSARWTESQVVPLYMNCWRTRPLRWKSSGSSSSHCEQGSIQQQRQQFKIQKYSSQT